MNETLYVAILVKNAGDYLNLPGFDRHAFFSDSTDTLKVFGDAVYFIDVEWQKNADRILYGS